jgi:cytochrome oxidase Cu insertion factor (SCO1/SenC/PrrC family)
VTEHHAAGSTSTRRVPFRRAALVVLLATAIGVGAGVALHQLTAHRTPRAAAATLPAFHGQAAWAAGERAAPTFTLRDQSGVPVSLSALRGRPVLLTFLNSQCKEQCPLQGRELASILTRLPAAQRPALVIVSVNPKGDTPAGIRHATRTWGLAGQWAWHWLNGTQRQLASIWHAYGVAVTPASGDVAHSLVIYLIDPDGYERTAYLFPFLPSFVQRDLSTLAREHA